MAAKTTIMRKAGAFRSAVSIDVSFGDRDTLQIIDVFDSRPASQAPGLLLLPILRELGIGVEREVHDACKITR